jgi:hypothetical protein
MNKYRLSASILSFILAVSALPVGAAANEIRPRAASDSEETIMIEEPTDSDEAGEINEIEDTVEAAESESEETMEEAVSETGEAVEPEEPAAGDAAGTEDAEDGGNESGTVVTHEVRLPSGQDRTLLEDLRCHDQQRIGLHFAPVPLLCVLHRFGQLSPLEDRFSDPPGKQCI